LWNLATHHPIGAPLHASQITKVTWSPIDAPLTGHDGRALPVVVSLDGKQLATGGDRVLSVTFSPDGKLLATGGGDGTVRLWDVATHRLIGGPLTSYTGAVYSVAFSADGKTLATGNSDGTVRLWDAATHGQIGKPLKGQVAPVTSLAFSPDGKTLASGSLDGTVRLWNIATQGQNVAKITDLVPHLCASAGRPLTRTEWARYVPQGLAYQRVCP
jgi:hypothetical protein